ncbi:unnamed protein product [Leptosia nina]
MQQQTASIRGAVTHRRQPELNADAVRCRPSRGFLLLSGRAYAQRSYNGSMTPAHSLQETLQIQKHILNDSADSGSNRTLKGLKDLHLGIRLPG